MGRAGRRPASGLIGVTDVGRFADLEVEVRDLVASLTDTDPDAFDLTWHYTQDGHDYYVFSRPTSGSGGSPRLRRTATASLRRGTGDGPGGALQRAIRDALGVSGTSGSGRSSTSRPAPNASPVASAECEAVR